MHKFVQFCEQNHDSEQFSVPVFVQHLAHIANGLTRKCVAYAEVRGLLSASVCAALQAQLWFLKVFTSCVCAAFCAYCK